MAGRRPADAEPLDPKRSYRLRQGHTDELTEVCAALGLDRSEGVRLAVAEWLDANRPD